MTTTLHDTVPAHMGGARARSNQPPVTRSGVAHFLSDSMVFARRNIEHIRQIPEKLLDVTMQPIMFVLLFSYVFGGAISISGGTYREYIIGSWLLPCPRRCVAIACGPPPDRRVPASTGVRVIR